MLTTFKSNVLLYYSSPLLLFTLIGLYNQQPLRQLVILQLISSNMKLKPRDNLDLNRNQST